MSKPSKLKRVALLIYPETEEAFKKFASISGIKRGVLMRIALEKAKLSDILSDSK